MNSEELKEKIENINKEIESLNEKLKDSADTVIIKGMYSRENLEDKLKDAKGNLAATKETAKINNERRKGKISSHLLKAQMNLREAKADFEERKELKDKAKLEKYIDKRLDYAEDSLALALLAAQEAKVAFLEALTAQIEYDELYGEEKK